MKVIDQIRNSAGEAIQDVVTARVVTALKAAAEYNSDNAELHAQFCELAERFAAVDLVVCPVPPDTEVLLSMTTEEHQEVLTDLCVARLLMQWLTGPDAPTVPPRMVAALLGAGVDLQMPIEAKERADSGACMNRSCSNTVEFEDDDLCPWCREDPENAGRGQRRR